MYNSEDTLIRRAQEEGKEDPRKCEVKRKSRHIGLKVQLLVDIDDKTGLGVSRA